MTHLQFTAGIIASLLGIAFASAALAQTASAVKREAIFMFCQNDADTAIRMTTTRDQMNHYLRFASCLENHDITLGRRHSLAKLGDSLGHR
jgi:hypothetical protein